MITSLASAASFQPSFGFTELEESPANVFEPATSKIKPKLGRTRQSMRAMIHRPHCLATFLFTRYGRAVSSMILVRTLRLKCPCHLWKKLKRLQKLRLWIRCNPGTDVTVCTIQRFNAAKP